MILLLINLVVTWYLVGLIWTVQWVHYPLFERVGKENFVDYEQSHSSRITPIVGIPMAIELLSAAWLCYASPPFINQSILWSGFVMVVAIWLSTALIQMPCHQKLLSGFDPPTHNRLVVSNWFRTLLWSGRGVLMLLACWQVTQGLTSSNLLAP